MPRLLVVLLVVACLVTSVSCGDIFVRGAINAGQQSASGVVSIVQFSAATGNGVSITIITLTGNRTASTFRFCGDQRTLFRLTGRSRFTSRPEPHVLMC
jgi:hypothetical protein